MYFHFKDKALKVITKLEKEPLLTKFQKKLKITYERTIDHNKLKGEGNNNGQEI